MKIDENIALHFSCVLLYRTSFSVVCKLLRRQNNFSP